LHSIVIYNKRKLKETIEIAALGGENQLFEREISGEIGVGDTVSEVSTAKPVEQFTNN
jgi:hypothetical protein